MRKNEKAIVSKMLTILDVKILNPKDGTYAYTGLDRTRQYQLTELCYQLLDK